MKKIIVITLVLFVGIFILITLSKSNSDGEETLATTDSFTTMKKDSILQFWALYKEATSLRMSDQYEQAADTYIRALAMNDQHEDALYYLGNTYLELGQYALAKARWEQLIRINPKNSRGYMQLADLYLNQSALFNIEKAEQACRESLKRNKEETGPVQLLGEVCLIRGQMKEAASLFESVSASNFKSVEAYFFRGYIAWKEGKSTKAQDLYKQAIDYARPVKHQPDKVIGEGDIKDGKGFGSVTSKSVFQPLINELPSVSSNELPQEMENHYRQLDALLVELKRRIH